MSPARKGGIWFHHSGLISPARSSTEKAELRGAARVVFDFATSEFRNSGRRGGMSHDQRSSTTVCCAAEAVMLYHCLSKVGSASFMRNSETITSALWTPHSRSFITPDADLAALRIPHSGCADAIRLEYLSAMPEPAPSVMELP